MRRLQSHYSLPRYFVRQEIRQSNMTCKGLHTAELTFRLECHTTGAAGKEPQIVFRDAVEHGVVAPLRWSTRTGVKILLSLPRVRREAPAGEERPHVGAVLHRGGPARQGGGLSGDG